MFEPENMSSGDGFKRWEKPLAREPRVADSAVAPDTTEAYEDRRCPMGAGRPVGL